MRGARWARAGDRSATARASESVVAAAAKSPRSIASEPSTSSVDAGSAGCWPCASGSASASARCESLLHGGPSDGERLGGSVVRAREVGLREGELGALAALGRGETIGLGEMLGGALRLVRASRKLAGAAPKSRADGIVGQRSAERVLRDRERVLVSEGACRVARLDECAGALRVAAAGKPLGKTSGGAVWGKRLRKRPQRDGAVTGAHRVFDRPGDVGRLGEVIGEKLRLLDRDLRYHAFDDLTDPPVKVLTVARRDRVVHELAQQRLPESVVAMARELEQAADAE